MLSQVISAQLQMHNIKKDAMRDSEGSEDPLNQTSRTLQDEEAKIRAEQQEVRKQMFINVQPYVQQTLQLGYQNPFAFSGIALPLAQQTSHMPPPVVSDLDQFNLSSVSSSDFLSLDSSHRSGKELFKELGKSARMTAKGGGRYSTLSQRSEGEVGQQSDDDVSIGEIRFPRTTL